MKEHDKYEVNSLPIQEGTFVPIEIQQFLLNCGWILTSSYYHNVPISRVYPKGIHAGQTWNYVKDRDMELRIGFEDNEKHTVQFWYGPNDNDCQSIKLRNIRSTLKRRGYGNEVNVCSKES